MPLDLKAPYRVLVESEDPRKWHKLGGGVLVSVLGLVLTPLFSGPILLAWGNRLLFRVQSDDPPAPTSMGGNRTSLVGRHTQLCSNRHFRSYCGCASICLVGVGHDLEDLSCFAMVGFAGWAPWNAFRVRSSEGRRLSHVACSSLLLAVGCRS